MTKPPSWNQIRKDAAAFAARWADETDENAGAQGFWTEFLAIFGVDRKRVAVFEKRAERTSTGGRGRIDMFWPGVLVVEHKSAGKDLAEAEDQALDYLDSIDQAHFPGLVATSDFQHIRLLDLGGDRTPFTFETRDLPLHIERFGYLAGYSDRQLARAAEHQVDIAAARLMGSLYERIAETGLEEHQTSVFLVRLLFLLFGDDTGLWEKSLFLEYLETRTHSDGSDLGPQIAVLFQTLDRPVEKRPAALDELLARFPYVNGHLFTERLDIPSFDSGFRDTLISCCLIDWGSIVPAIFGSLFQAVKSKEARRSLGEHYTTEGNILKVIGPLFLDELRAEFDAARHDLRKLQRLRDRIGRLRFLDPACGCGNFLVIAYREMRTLELDILRRMRDLSGQAQMALDVTLDLRASPAQFYGIEIEEWPAAIAEAAMFLVDHQANQLLAREFGEAPDRLPISTAATIVHGNALRMDWRELLPPSDDVYVLSNPPFVGMAWMTADQQADNRIAFAEAGATPAMRTGRLDYVACWYAKTVVYLKGTRGRAAFVSTNSITQGEQARSLLPFMKAHGFEIDFGHRTFRWTSEAANAAAVHVVVIGFSAGGQAKVKRLFDYPDITGEPKEVDAQHVNFYLVDADDVAPQKRYAPWLPTLPLATQGSKPWDGGGLIVEPDEVSAVEADPFAGKYLRPYRQAIDMMYDKSRWCLWLKDAEPADIRQSPILRDRLERVRAARRGSPTVSVQELADTPALFAQDRQPGTRYLALPEVSSGGREYIPARFYEPDVVAGNKLILIPGAPVWLFAYVQSAAFTAWVKTYAGRLKSDISISPGLTYFTFPFVEPDDAARERLESAAVAVFAARDAHPRSTMADLYDPLAMPLDLRMAHRDLDRTVDSMYDLPPGVADADRLRALVNRYVELSTQDQLALNRTKRRTRKGPG
jgi:hypothetical protein